MTSGLHKNYFWIEWEQLYLRDLLTSFQSIVIDQFLINTSFDSGKLSLSESEREQGWRSVGELAYSPRIKDVLEIPFDCFDEWLVFTEFTEVSSWQPIVNYSNFSLLEEDYRSMQTELWSQLEQVKPETYLAEGDRLIFITRNQTLYESVLANGKLRQAP